MQFDLISDLNIEQWNTPISWQGLGTSLVAVVAGNVSHDFNRSYQTILEISKHYRHVLYVDGFNEHNNNEKINQNRERLREKFSKYRNISYLYRNPIILDQVAFIGCNGWRSFDFCDPIFTKQECFHTLQDHGWEQDLMFEQWEMAMEDAHYISTKISQYESDSSIKKIVIVTNSIPRKDLIPLASYNITNSILGSSFLQEVSESNFSKLTHWVFGNFPYRVERVINNVKYISSPRGKPNSINFYYPELIKL